jgi:hypothetical protein
MLLMLLFLLLLTIKVVICKCRSKLWSCKNLSKLLESFKMLMMFLSCKMLSPCILIQVGGLMPWSFCSIKLAAWCLGAFLHSYMLGAWCPGLVPYAYAYSRWFKMIRVAFVESRVKLSYEVDVDVDWEVVYDDDVMLYVYVDEWLWCNDFT